ncbi:MAG: hypothetical protein QNK33_10695 [Bacteroidales bacterium]|nr:hypothetical protein [Bacteroidales bacterium]
MKKAKSDKKLLLPIIMIIIIILVIKQLAGNSFRQGAENYSVSALKGTNITSMEEFIKLKKGSIIRIDDADVSANPNNLPIISLKTSELFSRSSIKSLRRSSVPRIIIADDPGIEASVWTLLSQKGIKELMINPEREDESVLKYKFRPDTIMSK